MKMSITPGFSWIPDDQLTRRVDSIPLPKNLKTRFTNDVCRWHRNSGSEWTVGRLKSFKDCLLQSYALGGSSVAHKPEWFKTTPAGRLSGVFGDLWSFAMKNSQNLKAVLFLANMYTGVSRTESTTALLSEIRNEITKKPVVIPKRGHKKVGLTDVFKALKSIPGWKGMQKNCRLPEPLMLTLPGKESHAAKLLDDVKALAGTQMIGDTVSTMPRWDRKVLIDTALGFDLGVISSAKFSTVVGKVDITHEPGLKTRYFAAPNQVLQRALEPLKSLLLRDLALFPWDCTMDQRRADGEIRSALANRKTVHSVDMSKATDNFPWEFQLEVGKHLTKGIARDMLDLMDDIVRNGYWIMPDGSRVRWSKGQPLGLGPSFPLFTISHGLLLYILNGYKWDRMFFVLGDDVVILDDSLHQRYREVLEAWEIKVSETKSFSSSHIAQFAGANITRDSVMWIPKWRPLTRESLIDAAAWWYPGLTKGLPDHTLVEWVLSLPAPYGVGRNPKGLPFSVRFSDTLVDEIILKEKRRAEAVIPSSSRLDVNNLITVLRKKTHDEGSLYALQRMAEAYPYKWTVDKKLLPTGSILPDDFRKELCSGTFIPGYPVLRLAGRSRVDPYSLGSLQSWKQVWRRVCTDLGDVAP